MLHLPTGITLVRSHLLRSYLAGFYLLSFFFTSKAVYAAQSSLTLVQVAKVTIENHFSDHPKTIGEVVEALSKNIHPSYRQAKGLFITLSKHGKTRACWGQISGSENNLVATTAFTTEGALTKEYRYPPIKRQEVAGLNVQVTVIDRVEPVESNVSLHPLLDGLVEHRYAEVLVLDVDVLLCVADGVEPRLRNRVLVEWSRQRGGDLKLEPAS